MIAERTAERTIAASKLLAAGLLAVGLALGPTLTAAPASAQETQQTPWYMPQPWMIPQATAPTGQRAPGSYGRATRYQRAYGGFATYCYGNCGLRRGTIGARSGVVLYRPAVVLFDPRAYRIMSKPIIVVQPPRYGVRQPSSTVRRPNLTTLSAFGAPHSLLLTGPFKNNAPPRRNFVLQNGVRIIRPMPAN
ncbi:MAG: hypothetical protein ACREEP_16480 [Dongiaceae bacterium]